LLISDFRSLTSSTELRMRKCLIVVACVSLVLGWVAPVKAVDDADAAMAARIADMGTDTLRTKNASDPQYKQCIALLKAAAKLNPEEERYPRLMVEASNGSSRKVIGRSITRPSRKPVQ